MSFFKFALIAARLRSKKQSTNNLFALRCRLKKERLTKKMMVILKRLRRDTIQNPKRIRSVIYRIMVDIWSYVLLRKLDITRFF